MRSPRVLVSAVALAGCAAPGAFDAPAGHPARPDALMRVLLLAAVLFAPAASAQHGDHAVHAAGDLPSALTVDEVAGLLAGAGLGMARPAERNRYPGPLHALELADALGLTPDQRAAAERLRAAMLAEAVPLGEQIVAAERHLDAVFASGAATAAEADRITGHVAALWGRLRAVHLRAHLALRDALTPEQVDAYVRLRAVAH